MTYAHSYYDYPRTVERTSRHGEDIVRTAARQLKMAQLDGALQGITPRIYSHRGY